jgi:hypothetical protein
MYPLGTTQSYYNILNYEEFPCEDVTHLNIPINLENTEKMYNWDRERGVHVF